MTQIEQRNKTVDFYHGKTFDKIHTVKISDQKRTEDQSDRAKELEQLRQKKLDKAAFDERHWTKKPFETMRERDWRILREDFSISTKGGNIPKPLRYWKESLITDAILELINKGF